MQGLLGLKTTWKSSGDILASIVTDKECATAYIYKPDTFEASVKSGKDCQHIICYKPPGALPTVKKTANFVAKPRPDMVGWAESSREWRSLA